MVYSKKPSKAKVQQQALENALTNPSVANYQAMSPCSLHWIIFKDA